MIRIPLLPGVKLTVGGSPNPDTVKVAVLAGALPNPTTRVTRWLSKRGWMVLFVRYDWRNKTAALASKESA